MASLEGLKLRLKREYIRLTANWRKKKLRNKEFTIISNNCWGGFVYRSYNLPYNSPTIGLYFMAKDYIKFVSSLKEYLSYEIEFIDPSESRYYDSLVNDKRFGTYPIGLLKDIEIIFLHYDNEMEAREKWRRRVDRIKWDKILIKVNDQNGFTKEELNAFENLTYENKICFVTGNFKSDHTIGIRTFGNQTHILASQEPIGNSPYIDINEMINNL